MDEIIKALKRAKGIGELEPKTVEIELEIEAIMDMIDNSSNRDEKRALEALERKLLSSLADAYQHLAQGYKKEALLDA